MAFAREEKIGVEIHEDADGYEHFQTDISLIYVLEGRLLVREDQQQFFMEKEDVHLINSGVPYILEAEGEVLYVKLSVEYTAFCTALGTSWFTLRCDSSGEDTPSCEKLRG